MQEHVTYTVLDGQGSQARIYEGLTALEAIERAEAMLANGRKHVKIIGPSGPTDLNALKLAMAGSSANPE